MERAASERASNAPEYAREEFRTGRWRRNFDSAGRYDDWRPVARWRPGPQRACGIAQQQRTKQHEVRECLSQGERRGGEGHVVRGRADVTGRRARERGNDDASALGGEGYPATHLLYQEKRRSGGNNMTDGTPWNQGRGAAAMMSPVPQLQVYLTSHWCRSAMVSLPSSPPRGPRPTALFLSRAARGSAPG